MPINRKQIGLMLALIATLVLTWRTARDDESTALAMPTRVVSASAASSFAPNAAPSAIPSAIPSAAPQLPAEKLVLQTRPLVDMQADLFNTPIKPAPAPVRVANRAPARVPQLAPALPFKYLGRWQVADAQTLSLDYMGEVLTVQVGEIINGQYKLVAINDTPLQAQFLYIPLNQIQVMHIGAMQ